MSTELIATIARLRRAMPRNAGVIAVRDGLERMIAERRVVPTRVESASVVPTPAESVVPTRECPTCATRRASKSAA